MGTALLKEVTPRNVLMIGPTGCGKTEVARRMAKLSDAPFLKVEATKFTEVGYHGRDVDQIVRDLMDVSMVDEETTNGIVAGTGQVVGRGSDIRSPHGPRVLGNKRATRLVPWNVGGGSS